MAALSSGDANQALVRAFDEASESFKTQLVGNSNISATVAPSGQTLLQYGEKLNLAIGANYDIISYMASGTDKYLQKIYFSGTQVGTATIYKNLSTLFRVRLSPATYTQILDLATGSAFGTKIIAGDIIKIEVTNNSNNLADFDVTLQMMET